MIFFWGLANFILTESSWPVRLERSGNFWTSEIDMMNGEKLPVILSTLTGDTSLSICPSKSGWGGGCVNLGKEAQTCLDDKKCSGKGVFECKYVNDDIEKSVIQKWSETIIETSVPIRVSFLGVELSIGGQSVRGILETLPAVMNRFSGIFGIGGLPSCRANTFLSSFFDNQRANKVAMFQPPASFDSHGSFTLLTSEPVDVDWAEERSSGGWLFGMHHIKGCEGVDFLGNTSSYWLGSIDSSQQGLVLPSWFYDRLMRWRGHDLVWPILTFSIQEGSESVVLDLNRLRDSEGHSLVFRSSFESEGLEPFAGTLPRENPIIFGTLILPMLSNQIFLTFRYTGEISKVGFIWKKNDIKETPCAPAIECRGDQRWWAAGNACQNPKCEDFWFYVLDENLGVCRWSQGSIAFFWTFVVCMTIAEVIASRIRKQVLL